MNQDRQLDSYEPLGNRVLLKVVTKTESAGGIILGKEVQERWMEVVKVGYLVEKEVLNIGDTALMGQPIQGLVQMKFGDEDYVQVNLNDIVGRIPKAKLKLSHPNGT